MSRIKKPTLTELDELRANLLIRTKDLVRLRANLKDHIIFIARNGKGVRGYIHARIWNEVGYIENLSILKDFQGKGIAKELFSRVQRIMRNNSVKRIKLYVYGARKNALLFWKNRNFRVICSTKDKQGVPLLLLEEQL